MTDGAGSARQRRARPSPDRAGTHGEAAGTAGCPGVSLRPTWAPALPRCTVRQWLGRGGFPLLSPLPPPPLLRRGAGRGAARLVGPQSGGQGGPRGETPGSLGVGVLRGRSPVWGEACSAKPGALLGVRVQAREGCSARTPQKSGESWAQAETAPRILGKPVWWAGVPGRAGRGGAGTRLPLCLARGCPFRTPSTPRPAPKAPVGPAHHTLAPQPLTSHLHQRTKPQCRGFFLQEVLQAPGLVSEHSCSPEKDFGAPPSPDREHRDGPLAPVQP